MMVRAALMVMLALPMPATAQTFALPQGCEAYVTVQKRNCTVSHLVRCAGDPEGYQRRIDIDEGGMSYMGTIDAETQWMESWSVEADVNDRLLPGGADPASLSTLIATGVDTFDFQVETDGTYITRYQGQDRLTGEKVVIDGVTLDVTTFQVEARDETGALLWSTTGSEFIHREWRTFISGTRTTDNGSEVWDDDGTPVEFNFPGEAGFLTSTPRHGCGEMLSSLGPMARLDRLERS
jgi:hypothetical protein